MTDPVLPFFQFDYKQSVQRSGQINYGIVYFYKQNRDEWKPDRLMFEPKPADWEKVYGGLGCHPTPKWIETVDDLKTLIGWLEIETEFCIHVRQMTYNAVIPFTTLIQVGTWKRGDFLISAMPLRDEIEQRFKKVLQDPKILKIMCDCDSQVVALQRDFNIYIYGIADVCELIKIKMKKKSVKNYQAVCMEFPANECQELVHPSKDAMVVKASNDDHIHYVTHQVHFILRLFNRLRREATKIELAQCFENSWILSENYYISPHDKRVTSNSPSIATTEFLRSLRMYGDLWKETLDNRNPQHITERERKNMVALIEWRIMMSKVTNTLPNIVMTDLKIFELSVLPNPTQKSIIDVIGNSGYVIDGQLKKLSQILASEHPEEVMKNMRELECHNCLSQGHGPAAFCIYPKPPFNESIKVYMNRPGNEEKKKYWEEWRAAYFARKANLEEEAATASEEMQDHVW